MPLLGGNAELKPLPLAQPTPPYVFTQSDDLLGGKPDNVDD